MITRNRNDLGWSVALASNDDKLKTRLEEWCQQWDIEFKLIGADIDDMLNCNSLAIIADSEYIGQDNIDTFLDYRKDARFKYFDYEDPEKIELIKEYFDIEKDKDLFSIGLAKLILTDELKVEEIISELDTFMINDYILLDDENLSFENKSIENALIEGIKKTINRFEENPLFYFTEADIQASLMKDIMEENSKLFIFKDVNYPSVSLIHSQYPTNFIYEQEKLFNQYNNNYKELEDMTQMDLTTGQRGSYDLAILNKGFIDNMMKNPVCLTNDQGRRIDINDMNESIKNIMNEDIAYPILRKSLDKFKFQEELGYAIEVTFINPFNAQDKDVLKKIIEDNNKLKLAQIHSEGQTKVINLIFCSCEPLLRSNSETPFITQIKKYIEQYQNTIYEDRELETEHEKLPTGVINIFIESYIFKDSKNCNIAKETHKPICSIGGKFTSSFFYKLEKTLEN